MALFSYDLNKVCVYAIQTAHSGRTHATDQVAFEVISIRDCQRHILTCAKRRVDIIIFIVTQNKVVVIFS